MRIVNMDERNLFGELCEKSLYEQYEKEIIELKEKGLTKREIGERYGISKDQVKGV